MHTNVGIIIRLRGKWHEELQGRRRSRYEQMFFCPPCVMERWSFSAEAERMEPSVLHLSDRSQAAVRSFPSPSSTCLFVGLYWRHFVAALFLFRLCLPLNHPLLVWDRESSLWDWTWIMCIVSFHVSSQTFAFTVMGNQRKEKWDTQDTNLWVNVRECQQTTQLQ